MVRLWSGNTDLDLGTFATTLNFSIADIREPDKRNASYSKTLTLPGTKTNNKFFENLFEVDIATQTFNPNLKAKTVLSIDGVTQFKGALKLRQVNYLLNGEVTYDCNLIGNLADLYQSLGNKKLRDLDLSAYDHTFSKANIEVAWTPTIGTGYCYPMIDYGENIDLNRWDVGTFRPAAFVKTIFDKIVSDAGYNYSSTFLTSDLFKRLIIPNSQDHMKLTDAQCTARLFNAGRTTAQTFTDVVSGVIYSPILLTQTTAQINTDSGGSYFDNDGNFNTSTYQHQPNYIGFNNYFFTCDFSFAIDKTFAGTAYANEYAGELLVEIIKTDTSGVNNVLNSLMTGVHGYAADAAGTYTLTGSAAVAAENVSVGTGEYIWVRFTHASEAVFTSAGATWTITNFSFKNSVANNFLNFGDTVVLSSTLPDMLQKDFVTGLIRMFNLYIEQDANDENLLNIEPRNTYYNSTVEDWTAKLATEKNIEILPMAALDFKRITCQYKNDEDYFNKTYTNEYKRNYGSYLAEITNDFVQGDYKVETTFAPTPLVGNYVNDRIIPTIEQYNADTPPTTEPINSIPRILYWKGLLNCQTWNFRYFSQDNFKTQYPYAGHLDNPQAPTIDLSFGVPQKVYYGVNQFINSLTYTDNNLYNVYYKQMIDEVTDRDSKLVTAWFNLKPLDIQNLDFRKIIRVKNHYLRLNKVIDYSPIKPELTKCEFIKVVNYSTFVSASATMSGGYDTVINSRENAPVTGMGTWTAGNIVGRGNPDIVTGEKNYSGGGLSNWIGGRSNRVHGRNSSGVVAFGEDNIVQDGASGVVIYGYGNNIGFNNSSIFIQGSQNIINPGLKNVTLIKTNGKTITESDVIYINGAKQYTDTPLIRTTGWQYSNSKTLNSSPLAITGLEAQTGKYILIKELLFILDAGAVQYNFANNLKLRYTGGKVIVDIDKTIINSATDYHYQVTGMNGKIASSEGIELYSAADAAAGNGLYYIKCLYEIIDTII